MLWCKKKEFSLLLKKQSCKNNQEFYKKNNGKKPYKNLMKDKFIKCVKCGSFGHQSNTCNAKEKINQISNLNINEKLNENLINTVKKILC